MFFLTALLHTIHYSFLSRQAICSEKHPVHYTHMRPITPAVLTNSSGIFPSAGPEQNLDPTAVRGAERPRSNRNVTSAGWSQLRVPVVMSHLLSERGLKIYTDSSTVAHHVTASTVTFPTKQFIGKLLYI